MADSIGPEELSILDPVKHRGTGLRPIPAERDHQIGRLVEKLRRLDPEQLKALLDTYADRALWNFAERMAALAVRRQSRRDLNLGIVAAGIAGTITGDPRDVILRLALLWHSAQLLGLNAGNEFLAVAHELGGYGGELLESFAKRSPENQSLAVMGYVEGQDEQGFRYVPRRWEDDEAASSPGPVRKETVSRLSNTVADPEALFWQTVGLRRRLQWQVVDQRPEPPWVRFHHVSPWDDDWMDMWLDADGRYHQRFYKPGVDPTKLSDE